MTGQQIINKFRTYVDDGSELSTAEELALLNKKYNELQNDREWEWCKTTESGLQSGAYIQLPLTTRFIADDVESDLGRVVYDTDNNDIAYPIYPSSKRRQFRNELWYDETNKRIMLPTDRVHPITGKNYEVDLYVEQEALTLTTSPVFRAGFHDILVHAMALDFDIIDQMESAFSKQANNQSAYNNFYSDMCYEDAQNKDWDYEK